MNKSKKDICATKGKVGLATCFIDNYGACLQAYALQKKIKDCGFSCEIINYLEPDGYEQDTFKHKLLKNKIFLNLASIIRKNYKKVYPKKIAFDKFRKQYLKFGPKYYKSEDIFNVEHDYDACVCGSDQIWNPLLFGGNDKVYFLDFVPKGKKRIAYAPSIGIDKFPAEHLPEFEQLISKFDFLSVREDSGKKIIEENTQSKAKVVLDPTLLLNGGEWSNIAQPLNIKKPYIFCYLFGEREYIGEFVDYVKNKTNMQVVCIPFTKREETGDFKKVYNAGPCEFLWLIKNAALVITDSFHATAFSINFNTPFYSLLRNTDNEEINMNSRIFNILEMTKLTDRLITPETKYPFEVNTQLDFSIANSILADRRNKDFSLLYNALEGVNGE